MNYIKQKIKNITFPYLDHGKLALVLSVLAIAFVVSSSNSPCLQAQTCSVGSDNEFTGNISLKGGTANLGTFEASGITADRTWTLPDETGTLALSSGALSGLKIMATDVGGVATTTDIYPLSVGTIGQVLKVDPTASFLEYGSINEVPTLTALKSVSTTAGGDLETNDIYPLSLTVSRPLKTNSFGILEAGFLDPVADLTSGTGTALQELRVNSAATSLEFFTPSGGGGAWSEVASGSVTTGLTSQTAGSEAICFGVSIANDKRYKLWFDGGNEDNYGSTYSPGYSSYFIPLINDCTTDYDSLTSTNYITGGSSVGSVSNANFYGSNEGFCYVDGGWINTNDKSPMQTNGTIIFHGKNSTTGSEGFQAFSNIIGMVNNGSGVQTGQQTGQLTCSDRADYNAGIDITTITGFGIFIEQVASSGRTWVLWESTN